MTTETIAKKDTQKLQRAIVDGLEDVKAQDIQVFDTEHLSPLFERVIVASGTSNRQTKALAASVRDAVREAGFPKPRIEGEANGEWIIVDCAQVVVHIMQPNFRAYYHLEELWGEKPVRMKFGATKPLVKATPVSAAKPPAKKAATAGKKPAARKVAPRPLMPELAPEDMPKTPVARPASRAGAKAAPKPAAKTAARSSAAKPAAAKTPAARRPRVAAPAAAPAKAPARKPRTA
ncbi:MAG: ribosome silencing factor [Rhodoferax sp.]|jgi:ribosome-associated protein|nr:ribosome silencing factor [Rhodoferax sp.]